MKKVNHSVQKLEADGNYIGSGQSVPYQKAKELNDNSQTKSDKKVALAVARLVKDGRYFEKTYLLHNIYKELYT